MRSARSLNSERPVVTDKREAILRAAIRVFAHNGFQFQGPYIAASPRSDGHRLLISQAKENLIDFRSHMERHRCGPGATRKVSDPREKLRRIAWLHAELLGADRDLAVVFQFELRGSTKFIEEFSASVFARAELIRATLEEASERVCFAPVNAKIVSRFFSAPSTKCHQCILSTRYKLAPMADKCWSFF